ncbi:helix-turn-helix transcriptional regulator [Kitasatospora sp. NPDC002040]|uniref:helix-turn-helix transcriptional regulator n=1 Tax=Kitasatospora sp. NPDC002040 TaxID=3154661 RepID=UPI00332C215D
MSGSWRLATGVPDPRIADGVLGYRGFDLDLGRPQRRIELPTGAVTLVVNLGGTLRITRWGAAGGWQSGASFVAGQRSVPVLGEHDGTLRGIEINLAPWFCYAVLGVRMTELQDRQVELADLLGTGWSAFEERLALAPGWPDRFALLDRWLLGRRAGGPAPAPRVLGAWRRLRGAAGAVPVTELAAGVGWSQRHLELRFAEQIGLSPKAAARVLRLGRALRMLTAGEPACRTAHSCGYYDQAHLNRDFRALVGGSPGEFLGHRRMPARYLDRLPGAVTSGLLA